MNHIVLPLHPAAALLTALGLVVSFLVWGRRARERPQATILAIAGVAGALVGAKLGYWLCEGPIIWESDDFLLQMLTGKTILGSLLVGWLAVEWAKRSLGWKPPTGDDFARVLPIGIALGRVGCLLQGCCQGCALSESGQLLFGLERWPAAAVEIGFQCSFVAVVFLLRSRAFFVGQHFHIYLISYGLFRFGHEFVRDTPRYPGTTVSPYMLLALVCALAGTVGFVLRARSHRASDRNESVSRHRSSGPS